MKEGEGGRRAAQAGQRRAAAAAAAGFPPSPLLLLLYHAPQALPFCLRMSLSPRLSAMPCVLDLLGLIEWGREEEEGMRCSEHAAA